MAWALWFLTFFVVYLVIFVTDKPTDWRALCAELADALDEWQLGGGPPEDTADADLIARARTALAQPEPEGVGPSDEKLLALRSWSSHGPTFDSDLVDFARAVLARYARATIKPVSMAERLPGPEDCDERGWCWYWHPGEECWEMVPVVTGTLDEWTHWLPHHALPLPQP